MAEWKPPIDRENLSLSGLTMFDLDPEKIRECHRQCEEERRAKEQAFRDKYGERWKEEYRKQERIEEEMAEKKIFNTEIYEHGPYPYKISGRSNYNYAEHIDARMRELYKDRYEELTTDRVDYDPRIKELLLQEALETNERAALPDILLEEYDHRLERKG